MNGWLRYEEQEPTGWRPDWWPSAHLMSWMKAVHPFGPSFIPPAAFMPSHGSPAADTQGDKAAKVLAGGGRVVTPPKLIIAED